MNESERSVRQQVIDTCCRLDALGLNQGSSGNVSVRCGPNHADGFFLTPTSLPYDRMGPEDIVHVDLGGKCSGPRRPSSELPFHLEIMRTRPDATAIVHTHSVHATAVSCLRREIPAIHYLVGLFGGATLRCADYATFGTPEISANLLQALSGRRGALLANHGLVVLGSSLDQALSLTLEAETLATIYLHTLAAGEPVILSDEEMMRIVEKFRAFGYGPVA